MPIIGHPTPKLTLDTLLEIKEYINSIDYCDQGICSLFTTYARCCYTLKYCLAQAEISWKDWPEYSGSFGYPVPAHYYAYVVMGAPVHEYNHTENKWDKTNPYCQSRYRLLDWLIEQLQTYMNAQEQSNE